MSEYTSSPWAADTPLAELLGYRPRSFDAQTGQCSKLHSRIMRGLEALSAVRAYKSIDSDHLKEIFLSSGGKQTGKSWTSPPRYASQCMENDHFRMALQLRLGLVQAPAGAVCQMPRSNPAEGLCMSQLSRRGPTEAAREAWGSLTVATTFSLSQAR